MSLFSSRLTIRRLCVSIFFQIDYPSFARNFYEEHADIAALTSREVQELRKKLGIKVCLSVCLSPGVEVLNRVCLSVCLSVTSCQGSKLCVCLSVCH